jgi:hypothetical protein
MNPSKTSKNPSKANKIVSKTVTFALPSMGLPTMTHALALFQVCRGAVLNC